MTKPTMEQIEQCRLAQQDIDELIGRLQAEGMDIRIILAALGTSTAAALLTAWGGQAVPTWFAQQSAMTMHLAKN